MVVFILLGIKLSKRYLYNNQLKFFMIDLSAFGLVCTSDGKVHPATIGRYFCETCFGNVFARRDFSKLDTEAFKQDLANGPNNISRCRRLLLGFDSLESEGVGYTPLIQHDELALDFGLEPGNLFLKYDGGKKQNSFKVRGVEVILRLIDQANKEGKEGGNYEAIGSTSTGNLAVAVATQKKYTPIILVHGTAEERLMRRTLSQGAYVIRVGSNYSTANDMLREAVNSNEELQNRIAFANINLRPYYAWGSQTIGFELAEQLKAKEIEPNEVEIVHPVAAGLSLWQIFQAFVEFKELGIVNSLPRMNAIQNGACYPIVKAWEQGEEFANPMKPLYVSKAETLTVSNPGNGFEALKTLGESKGSAVAVSEGEIDFGERLLSKNPPYFDNASWTTDYVGAAVVGGLGKLIREKLIDTKKKIVLVLTDGHPQDGNYDGPLKFEKLEDFGRFFSVGPDSKAIGQTLEDILDGRI